VGGTRLDFDGCGSLSYAPINSSNSNNPSAAGGGDAFGVAATTTPWGSEVNACGPPHGGCASNSYRDHLRARGTEAMQRTEFWRGPKNAMQQAAGMQQQGMEAFMWQQQHEQQQQQLQQHQHQQLQLAHEQQQLQLAHEQQLQLANEQQQQQTAAAQMQAAGDMHAAMQAHCMMPPAADMVSPVVQQVTPMPMLPPLGAMPMNPADMAGFMPASAGAAPEQQAVSMPGGSGSPQELMNIALGLGNTNGFGAGFGVDSELLALQLRAAAESQGQYED
jgi:hypothetical protein